MKYDASAFGRRVKLDVKPGAKTADGATTFHVSVDGSPPAAVDARLDGDVLQWRGPTGLWRAVVLPGKAGTAPDSAFVRGESIKVSLVREGAAGPDGAAAGATGAFRIASPMPGRVVAVRVAVGDRVDRGDLLVTLEAMKMQNEFLAPASGRITRLQAVAGQVAAAGDVLVEIEPGAGRS